MKKLNILFMMSLLLVSANCVVASNDVLQQEQQVEQLQQDTNNEEFLQYSTDQYLYAVSTVEQPAESDVVVAPEVVNDTTVGNYFNNGKTRTLITQETKDAQTIITTETWKTANPSYLTWENGVKVGFVIYEVVVIACLYKYIQYKSLYIAYHESAHTLMQALTQEKTIAEYVTIKKPFDWSSFKFGKPHLSVKFTSDRIVFESIDEASILNEVLGFYKNNIMMLLSGGIGIDLYKEERLPASKFLGTWHTSMRGMGNIGNLDNCDMKQAGDNAKLYYNYLNNLPLEAPVDSQKINKILSQSYEDAYDILDAHRDRLDEMAQKLYQEQTIHQKDIYEIAGMDIPLGLQT